MMIFSCLDQRGDEGNEDSFERQNWRETKLRKIRQPLAMAYMIVKTTTSDDATQRLVTPHDLEGNSRKRKS